MSHFFRKTIKTEFEQNIHQVETFLNEIHLRFKLIDTTPYCMNMIRDYIDKMEGSHIIFGRVHRRSVLTEIIISVFWIMNKFVEDDYIYLEELINKNPVTRQDIIIREIDIIMKCPNISKYINFIM